MRRTLKLLLLLGIGLALAGNKDGSGPTPGNGDNTIDPNTGKPKTDEQRKKDTDYQGTSAQDDFDGVLKAGEKESQDGRAQDTDGDGDPDVTETSGGQNPVEGPAANIDPRPPNQRHNLNSIRGNSRAKDENTIVLPGTDVAGDIADIKAGNATWNAETQQYEVNGRTYGMETPLGTLYPVSGDGFVNLNRAEYQMLKTMMASNGDLDQVRQQTEQNPFLNDPAVWDNAFAVFQQSNRYQG